MLNRKLITSALVGTFASLVLLGAVLALAEQRHSANSFDVHVDSPNGKFAQTSTAARGLSRMPKRICVMKVSFVMTGATTSSKRLGEGNGGSNIL